MPLFDQINFNIPATATSSQDFRLLDTTCDHIVRNENTQTNISPLLKNMPYSGNSSIYNNIGYSHDIDPNASIFINTKYPLVSDGSFRVYEVIDGDQKVTETTVVPDDLANSFTLQFPPRTNSVTAIQKIIDPTTGDVLFVDFTNYSLSQLYGIITFNNEDDIGETIIFSYLPDKRKIIPKNKDGSINYELAGTNQNGTGIIKLYGRALFANNSQIFFKYKTEQAKCIKCLGLGFLNDLDITQNGRLQLVYDFSKVIQDFFKRFNTIKGSSVFDSNEGTEINTLIGVAKGDGFLADTFIKNEIVNLVYTIRDKQKDQQQLQSISAGEQIAQINNVDVRAVNATDFEVYIDIQSKSGSIEQIQSVVSTKFAR